MSKPLISAGALISSSWQLFIKNWKVTLKASAWLLLPLVLLSLPLLLKSILGEEMSPAFDLLSGLGMIFGILFSLHVSIRLMELVLAQDRGEEIKDFHIWKATPFFFSYIWIAILTGIAVMIGYILLILPGIWAGVALLMAPFILLEDGIKGEKALLASVALVKGRWWSTLWLILAPGIVFGLLFIAALFLVSAVAMAFSLSEGPFPILMQSIPQIILTPLILTAQVKAFHALKESR